MSGVVALVSTRDQAIATINFLTYLRESIGAPLSWLTEVAPLLRRCHRSRVAAEPIAKAWGIGTLEGHHQQRGNQIHHTGGLVTY